MFCKDGEYLQLNCFLGVDPLAASGSQDMFSPYAAMGNAPESMVDPNGMTFDRHGNNNNQILGSLRLDNPIEWTDAAAEMPSGGVGV